MANNNSHLKAVFTHMEVGVAVVVVALALGGSQTATGAKPPSNISVTTNFDFPGSGSAIESDNGTPYSNNTDGVTSILTTNGYNGIVWGDWQFDTYNSSARSAGHSFNTADVVAVQPLDPHYTAPASPPFTGTRSLKSHVAVACTLINNDMLTMWAGQSFNCPLHNRFYVTPPVSNGLPTNVDYNLAPSISFTGQSETTDVLVTCNGTDSGGCNDWFIDPIDPGMGAVARLVTASTSKGKPQPPRNLGDFYMKFHIHITRP